MNCRAILINDDRINWRMHLMQALRKGEWMSGSAESSRDAGVEQDSRLIGVLAAMPAAAAVLDAKGQLLYWNNMFARLLPQAASASAGAEALAGLPAALSETLVNGGLVENQPCHVVDHDGHWHHLLCTCRQFENAQRGPLRLLSLEDDVAENAGEAYLRRVLDSLFAFVGLLAPDGTVIEANRAPLEAAGIALADVRGKKIWDTYWWSHDEAERERVRAAVERAARGEVSRYDLQVRMRGDSRMAIDFMIAPMQNEKGIVTHLVPSAIDVSDRKLSEQALRLSEARFRQVVEAAPDGLAMVDGNGCMALVNGGMERLFGYSRDELLGQPIEKLIPARYLPNHPRLRTQYMQSPSTRDMAGRKELYALRKDGTEFPAEIGLNAMTVDGQNYVLATVFDVTRRRADQQAIENALTEKTALLDEVHHRVKNNLQVISSLLSLQSRHAPPEVAAQLAESQGRVKAMALIHQLLYERHDFSRVDLGSYLNRLCNLLRESLSLQRGRINIQLQVPISEEPLFMDLQRAVPCGLLVNELVTNALKHAFPGEARGTVTIRLELGADGRGAIIVADDGVGLPTDVELGRSKSLGFQLVPLLVEQLGGDLKLSRDAPGTRFELRFNPQAGGKA